MLLAIDTSADYVSVALFDGTKCLAHIHESMACGQGETLIPFISKILKKGKCEPKHLEKIAVAVGPGSFTGVRIGLAVARAFALALGVPVVGVTNFDIAAFGSAGPIKVVLDTKRGDFFVQDFNAKGKAVGSPAIQNAESLKKDLPFTAVGSGADSLAEEIGCKVTKSKYTSAEAIGQIVAQKNAVTCGAVPLYLRDADVTV